jgi:two-component system response regulator (stage 0 sporulation protein A)
MLKIEAGNKRSQANKQQQEEKAMTKTECAVYDLLKEIGVPTHKKGYAYIQEAVTNKYDGKYEDFSITGPKGIYCDVAKKFRTEASRVERDIRSAIDYAFNYGDPKVLYGIFGNSIAPGKGKPTNAMFIFQCAKELERRKSA